MSDFLDLIVVGGGMGGLSTAALAQKMGLRVALLEAHTTLGGCAGYFSRGPFHFDAGATALMGLGPGEPIGDLLAGIGLDFQAVKTPGYRVCLPDREITITPDAHAFLDAIATVFPGRNQAKARFWNLQQSVGQTLFAAASRVPRLPVRSIGDLLHDARILGLSGLLAATTSLLTVSDILRLLRIHNDVPFRSLVAMLLQDTAQAGPETVPFANAAACLEAYRMGMSRPVGGMRALAEGLGHRFAAMGGDLRTASLVDRIEKDGDHFEVTTRRRERLKARQIALNLPLDLAARLLGKSLDGRRATQSRAKWSAFTGYVAIRREAVPDDAPLFHQVLQDYDRPIHDGNNVLISLSPVDDEGYGPANTRVGTMSTHTLPEEWQDPDRPTYEAKKTDYQARMLDALARALPDVSTSLVHAEFASPRSFERYTRRINGAVGGPPVSRSNSNFLAVGSDVFGPGIWVVGDSVFPGQGTMAVVLSAIRVVERITGASWSSIKHSASREVGTPETFPLPTA